MKFHYRTITNYRELPPKWRIVDEKKDFRRPADRYLDGVDRSLGEAQSRVSYGAGSDVVSLVFRNQMIGHEISSRQLAYVVEERRALMKRHLDEIDRRLDELRERKPFRRQGPFWIDDASLTDVERQTLMLEFQKRALELDLWRDTHELRTNLVKERQERESTHRRIGFLAGGGYGGT